MSSVTAVEPPYASKLSQMTEEQQAEELKQLLSTAAFVDTLSSHELAQLQDELERRQSLLSLNLAMPEANECVEVSPEAYWCDDMGRLIDTEPEISPEPGPLPDVKPVALPDGRLFSMYTGVESHEANQAARGPAPKRKLPGQKVVGVLVLAVIIVLSVVGELFE